MKKVSAFVSVFLCCQPALSDSIQADGIHCGPRKVEKLQIQDNDVLILLQGNGWKPLTSFNEPSASAKLSAAIAAKAQGDEIELIFRPNADVNCQNSSYSVKPYKVRY